MDQVDQLIAEVERPTAWERCPIWFRRAFNRLRIAVAIYRVTRTPEARRAHVHPLSLVLAWKRSWIISSGDRGARWRCVSRELFKPVNEAKRPPAIDPYEARP